MRVKYTTMYDFVDSNKRTGVQCLLTTFVYIYIPIEKNVFMNDIVDSNKRTDIRFLSTTFVYIYRGYLLVLVGYRFLAHE